ncbi:NIPSNAP family protein [Aquincola sp. S2]|uniref:NIPSNAP family protein n=1 Tax=Pseudaquabacterium terrae TaxID=2732868 RepID=A0ABX2EJK1_9BURK|nr:NIPSNAP family protein [Aquabacterium terrae]NRF68756.1 NIPSNAP family protein [Aquabacterium terrae]
MPTSTHALPPVIELRQYTLHPGRRDELIELFEREFLFSQQDCGMRVLGQFRDLDAPDRFVWLRGFAGMPQRAQALADFYGGPIWQAHRNAANATMIDSDDVLMLRPCVPVASGAAAGSGRVIATICPLRAPADDALRRQLSELVLPRLAAAGATPLACLETEPARNNFPRLPVREGEQVVVWLASVPRDGAWPALDIGALLDRWLRDLPTSLHLQATPRSAWR